MREISMEKFTAFFGSGRKLVDRLSEELPDANSQGRMLAEGRENLKEAIKLIIETTES
jgi:hypothetical protein